MDSLIIDLDQEVPRNLPRVFESQLWRRRKGSTRVKRGKIGFKQRAAVMMILSTPWKVHQDKMFLIKLQMTLGCKSREKGRQSQEQIRLRNRDWLKRTEIDRGLLNTDFHQSPTYP